VPQVPRLLGDEPAEGLVNEPGGVPRAAAGFVAQMEEVLATYATPYDSARPVVCMDEQPVQLLKETRSPIPGTSRRPKRVDYEYEQAGTANIVMFTEPLAGWREVTVRGTRTRLDWADESARLLEGRYAKCPKAWGQNRSRP